MLRQLCVLTVAAAALGAAPAVADAAPPSLSLEELTWTELRDALAGGMTTILVPIGGTEQNGPHMALGKHNVRVKVLADKIAHALGNALVAPVIAYVPEGGFTAPAGHMRFPGTISVTEQAFEGVLDGAARSFKLHGFHDIVFLGDHGGTQRGEKLVADRLDREWAATPVRVHALEQYYLAGEDEFARTLEAKGYSAAVVGKHAGLGDTSLMLAVDPRLVRMDRLKSTADANGVSGDPAQSSAALGQLAVDAIVAESVAAIRKAEARP
ncbi:MAG TPA: creatininase family protein [Stellaceae bacterium]|nr:creatininase family protein [Stellaceae bacterium]